MSDKRFAQFAVVGHPNKGKSSIVSTLSHNDSIGISSRSGTTEKADTFTVSTQSSHFDLIDTPGFQRPTKVLCWLQDHAVNASERAATVKKFVTDKECQRLFRDEVELLTPIVNGAAILYVVDGSRPYGKEYEAEMEILRWTGQPSMALVNPIENADCIEEWQQALAQYFKTVRVFNPFDADFHKQIELLRAFTVLNNNWVDSLTLVIKDLTELRKQKKQDAIAVLTRLVNDLCRYQYCQKVLSKEQAKQIEPILSQNFTTWIKQREEEAISELLAIYAHNHTQFSLNAFSLPPDLFDCEEWFAWGLNKKQLIAASAIAGAMGGAAVDMAVAGSSFMVGAIGGGLIGAGSAWFGSGKLMEMRIKGLPIGGYQACVGPIKNRNFPYVVIGRFLYLYQQISNLNHADRRTLELQSSDFQNSIELLEKSDQKALHQAAQKLTKQKFVDDLETILSPLFK